MRDQKMGRGDNDLSHKEQCTLDYQKKYNRNNAWAKINWNILGNS